MIFEEMYRLMWQIRFFEWTGKELIRSQGKNTWHNHLSIGRKHSGWEVVIYCKQRIFMTTTIEDMQIRLLKVQICLHDGRAIWEKKGGTNHGTRAVCNGSIADSDTTGNLESMGLLVGVTHCSWCCINCSDEKKNLQVVMCYAGDGSY